MMIKEKKAEILIVVDELGGVGSKLKYIDVQPIERLALLIAELEAVKMQITSIYANCIDIEWDENEDDEDEGEDKK